MSVYALGRGLKPLLTSFAITVLVACTTLPGATVQPIQSPNDDHQYRMLTLPNELQVLLISDPDSPKAAAALDVMVGSGDNPPGWGGLAHFLEHMLFLGTDKYPDAAEYEEYVSEHGGSRNAYTSFENTNYFFDVSADALPEALDRFAQFFISPRFDADYVDREKNAVQAEYQMGLKSDARRGLDVLQEVMNPDHPFSQFAVGSLETLADRPDASVRDQLLQFYEQHYSANVMRLVVLGTQSLDDLEALVAPMFAAVPNRSVQPRAIDAPLIRPEQLPMLVQVKPLATQRQLEVSFPVADYREQYKAKPLSYLGNLVGHEGEGSLLSQLKAEGLAESLSAGSGLAWRGGGLFSINVSLTAAGAADYQRVLQLVFAYLEMLEQEGPQRWLYEEQSRLAALRFRFHEDADPIGYVSSLASGMHYYAPEDILRGPYEMTEYDASLLNRLLRSLQPANALVILNNEDVTTDQLSTHYEVPYSAVKADDTRLAGWRSQAPESELTLPAPNEFIAEDVSLVEVAATNPANPAITLQRGRQTIWFMQDAQFHQPKGATYINFRSPRVGQSAYQTAAAVLYTAMLRDTVNEFAYPALLAGLSFDIYKHAQGISLRISGYDDKQALLLERLLEVIESSPFSAARFNNIRADMIRSLQNSVARRPSSQVVEDLQEALLYGEWGEQALIRALQQIELPDMQTYAQRFWQDASAEVMIYGNYELEVVDSVAESIEGILAEGDAPAMPPLKVVRLAADESLQYAVAIPHDDSVVAWYLQGEGNSWRDRAATAMTGQIIKSGFFQQLRTEQQLGYVVSSFPWPQLDVPGLVLLIQSPAASAPDVVQAMDTYMGSVLGSTDADQFKRHQRALVNEILQPDKNLWERAEFYWQSIAKKQYDFNSRQHLADAVEALSMADWSEYYQRVFRDHRRSLQVVAPGRWEELPVARGYTVFHDAPAIKQGHEAYTIE